MIKSVNYGQYNPLAATLSVFAQNTPQLAGASPDGSFIAYVVEGNEKNKICIVNVGNNESKTLAEFPAFCDNLSWSDDAQAIALSIQEGDSVKVAIIHRDGSVNQTIWPGPSESTEPHFRSSRMK